MRRANGSTVVGRIVSVTDSVPRRGLSTIAAYISQESRVLIELLQSQQETDGDRRSDSWIVDQALREYIINENRDISFEKCTGSDQIIGYVSPETKQWVKQFCKTIGRSESWVTAKAIAVFLKERGL
jgi:predicted transcriptional regulator